MAVASGPAHQKAGSMPRSRSAAGPARALRRLTRKPACPRCNDTGLIYVVCPDAGAVKLPCDCRQRARLAGHIGLAEVVLAALFVASCCAVYYLV
jgi:hypothetical protein